MLDLVRISTFSTFFFLFIFQFSFISRKIIGTIKNIKDLEELTLITFMMKEDILKSLDIMLNGNVVQISGFMMSLSDLDNDSQWGIILNCQDGKANIFNLNPPTQIFVLSPEDNSISTKNVLAKTKIKQHEFLVYFSDCNHLTKGELIFSDFYRIRWYSQEGKIYREVERYYDGKVAKSKFLVLKANLKTEEGKIVRVSKGNSEISFSVR